MRQFKSSKPLYNTLKHLAESPRYAVAPGAPPRTEEDSEEEDLAAALGPDAQQVLIRGPGGQLFAVRPCA